MPVPNWSLAGVAALNGLGGTKETGISRNSRGSVDDTGEEAYITLTTGNDSMRQLLEYTGYCCKNE